VAVALTLIFAGTLGKQHLRRRPSCAHLSIPEENQTMGNTVGKRDRRRRRDRKRLQRKQKLQTAVMREPLSMVVECDPNYRQLRVPELWKPHPNDESA
jgi:hypothetical protein